MSQMPVCVETSVPQDDVIVSHTDLNGIITYANNTFAKISGYKADELVSKPHNIVRHPDMPKSLFKNLWETVAEGKVWSGYVKNLRKDGGFYWVYAQVSQLLDKEQNIIGYKSLRAPVEDKKRAELEIAYTKLKMIEERQVKLTTWISSEAYHILQKKSLDTNKSVAFVIDDIVLGR